MMSYEYSNDVRLQGTPAMVNLATGKVYINREKWNKLTEYEKAIVLLHEEGHFRSKTIDEIKADAYAVDKYLAEEDNPRRRAELVHTIFCNIDNSPANLKRRTELVKYLLQYEEKSNESEQAKRLSKALYEDCYCGFVTEAITIIGGAIKLGTSVYNLYNAWKNKTKYFDDYSKTEREKIVTEVADAVIYDEFLRLGGNLNELYAEASRVASDSNSLAYKIFLSINQVVPISPKWFENKSQITAEEGSLLFWGKSGWTIPAWTEQRVNYLAEDLEDYWNNLSLIDKIKYSTNYKIYAVIYILILVLLWKKL